jgi:hypothetical protein
MRYFYKITNNSNKSFSSSWLKKADAVQYIPGKWVKPRIKGSRLMVFKRLKDAESFMGGSIGKTLWRCEVKSPKKQRTIADFWRIYDNRFISSFWKGSQEGVYEAPEGSYSVLAVRLISKV